MEINAPRTNPPLIPPPPSQGFPLPPPPSSQSRWPHPVPPPAVLETQPACERVLAHCAAGGLRGNTLRYRGVPGSYTGGYGAAYPLAQVAGRLQPPPLPLPPLPLPPLPLRPRAPPKGLQKKMEALEKVVAWGARQQALVRRTRLSRRRPRASFPAA